MTTGKRQRVGLRKRGDGGERAGTKRRVGAPAARTCHAIAKTDDDDKQRQNLLKNTTTLCARCPF